MLSLAQFVDGSAEEMSIEDLKKIYQIADSDGDSIAVELIVKELEKRK